VFNVQQVRIASVTLASRHCVPGCGSAMLRMEDKIRRLCTQLLAAKGKDDDEEFRAILAELREALRQHIESLRSRFATYPLVIERRIRDATPATSELPWLAQAPHFKITCHICDRPLSLRMDTVADEEGKAVHQTCYIKLVLKGNSPATSAADQTLRQESCK
jgi:hypothetical protein